MQDMSYYAESNIGFSEIETCAQSLGYRCERYDWYGPHLNVSFQNKIDATGELPYCRWNEGAPLSADDPKRRKILRQFKWNPVLMFWIQYQIVDLPQLRLPGGQSRS